MQSHLSRFVSISTSGTSLSNIFAISRQWVIRQNCTWYGGKIHLVCERVYCWPIARTYLANDRLFHMWHMPGNFTFLPENSAPNMRKPRSDAIVVVILATPVESHTHRVWKPLCFEESESRSMEFKCNENSRLLFAISRLRFIARLSVVVLILETTSSKGNYFDPVMGLRLLFTKFQLLHSVLNFRHE